MLTPLGVVGRFIGGLGGWVGWRCGCIGRCVGGEVSIDYTSSNRIKISQLVQDFFIFFKLT